MSPPLTQFKPVLAWGATSLNDLSIALSTQCAHMPVADTAASGRIGLDPRGRVDHMPLAP
jgi:hypothetical protein